MTGTLDTIRCRCGLRLWRLTVRGITFGWCGRCDRRDRSEDM